MGYTVSFDLRFRNDYRISYQDAPAICCVVNHHHYTSLLTVHHAKRTGEKEKKKKMQDFTLLHFYSQSQAARALKDHYC